MSLRRMTAHELQQRLQMKPHPLLIDLRPADAILDCRIDVPSSLIIHIPFDQFLDHQEETLAKLPRDRQLVLICGRGKTAIAIGFLLEDHGYEVAFLQNGMLGWNLEELPVITKNPIA